MAVCHIRTAGQQQQQQHFVQLLNIWTGLLYFNLLELCCVFNGTKIRGLSQSNIQPACIIFS